MMKKNLAVQLLFCMALAVGTNTHAQQSQAQPSPGLQSFASFEELTNTGPLANSKLPGDFAAKSGAAPLAAAPPLTKLFVYAVGSTNCGWEYMTTIGQISTTCNHGGAQLRSAVLEIGYGSSPIAWMSGALLPSSANYQITPVCVVGGVYSWPCPAGSVVVGFLRYYKLDGYQSGLFRYQNTSTNSPWNTLSTQINIL